MSRKSRQTAPPIAILAAIPGDISMQVRSTLTPEEYREAALLSRSKYFWLRFFAANWYASIICLLILGVGISDLIHHTQPRWDLMALYLAVFGGFIAFSWYRYNEKIAKAGVAQNADTQVHIARSRRDSHLFNLGRRCLHAMVELQQMGRGQVRLRPHWRQRHNHPSRYRWERDQPAQSARIKDQLRNFCAGSKRPRGCDTLTYAH